MNQISDTTNLVVGLGEVGSAIQEVLNCTGHDPQRGIEARGTYRILHICFPYNQSKYDFINEIKHYKDTFKSDLIIIHSTVPVGTSGKVDAVHSPIRGVHPHLAKGIRTFVKFFGGARAREAAAIFEQQNIKTEISALSEETEAAKLWDTTQYGAMILLNKEIHEFCNKHGLNFDTVYTKFNKTYNEGYVELGRQEVVRPYLKYVDGPIGGHCIVQNAELLKSKTAEAIVEQNQKLKS